jgi:hypothetical protein
VHRPQAPALAPIISASASRSGLTAAAAAVGVGAHIGNEIRDREVGFVPTALHENFRGGNGARPPR